jgi:hypothetical protein
MSIRSKEVSHDKEVAIIEFDDRDLILHKLNDAIDYLHHKAIKGRVTDAKSEKVRIAWFKALAYACSIYNQIKRDIELDQLKEEVETLKNHIETLDNLSKEKGDTNDDKSI